MKNHDQRIKQTRAAPLFEQKVQVESALFVLGERRRRTVCLGRHAF